MRILIASVVLLFMYACTKDVAANPTVAVDIYQCSEFEDDTGVELKKIIITCAEGKKPSRGGCELIGSGMLPAKSIDTELCQ